MRDVAEHPGWVALEMKTEALEAEVKSLKKEILVMWRALKLSADSLDFGGDPTWINVYALNLVEQAKREIENAH